MADHRRWDAICTYTGRSPRPLDPNPEDIDIEDIAHSLANQCRYTGHTSSFYSVAQHCVHVSQWLESQGQEDFALWGLLHDASEAYLSDIARPIKRFHGDFGNAYAAIEHRLTLAIIERFELAQILPMPAEVERADDVLLGAEVRDLMPEHPVFDKWVTSPSPWREELQPWSPKRAKSQFLWRYKELTR